MMSRTVSQSVVRRTWGACVLAVLAAATGCKPEPAPLAVSTSRASGEPAAATSNADADHHDADHHDGERHDGERQDGERRDAERRDGERHAPDPGAPRGPVVHSIAARWRCHHTPGCFSDPWPGSVIAWPAWAAHQSNGRSGNVLRFVYSTRGEPLHPYMGPWAQGCEVTAESGTVKVVEWKRGSEQWRETVLHPGQSHVIALVPPEDGALIEGPDDSSSFSVSLRNCTPQRIQP